MTVHTPRTFRKTIHCKNPQCGREFVPDADHRYGSACCALCARALTTTPRITGQRVTPNLSQTVIAPHVNRRHAKDNRE